MQEKTKVVVDATTIYEIDMDCYRCLTEEKRNSEEKKQGEESDADMYHARRMKNVF